MSAQRLRTAAAAGLIIGALLGMAGSFVPSAELRGLAWGVDGVALIVASALLAVHHVRQGHDQLAAGFLVFLAGETLIVSGSAMELTVTAARMFGGAALTPLSKPLPFYAYPFLAITLFGWAWAHVRSCPTRGTAE